MDPVWAAVKVGCDLVIFACNVALRLRAGGEANVEAAAYGALEREAEQAAASKARSSMLRI